eukprot:scaffold230597_cov13-Prasinocladus_malaysianus.AAC.1
MSERIEKITPSREVDHSRSHVYAPSPPAQGMGHKEDMYTQLLRLNFTIILRRLQQLTGALMCLHNNFAVKEWAEEITTMKGRKCEAAGGGRSKDAANSDCKERKGQSRSLIG